MVKKKISHDKLGGNLEDVHMRKKRTLNELRQLKTFGYRAPDEKNVSEAPVEKEEITLSEGKIEITTSELQIMHGKLDMLDKKIEFLLKHLEL